MLRTSSIEGIRLSQHLRRALPVPESDLRWWVSDLRGVRESSQT